MKYKKVIQGHFIDRPNRFIANVNIDGKMVTVHVKNTGRCKEILKKDALVFLSESNNENRKTKYDLISVIKSKNSGESLLINIDSQIVNDVAEEWVKNSNYFSKDVFYKREVTYENSRFDFYIENKNEKIFLEVKGVTLENDGVASFPDAPTLRGIKHIEELCKCKKEGYRAIILFVIQMKGIHKFKPNSDIHPDFAKALKNAQDCGVEIICIDCNITDDSIEFDNYVSFEI
jgi:sugar fermentation stimulation protein A